MPDITVPELEDFINRVEDFDNLKSSELIDYFLYFVTIEKGIQGSALKVRTCFSLLRLNPYSNIPAYLKDNLRGKGKESPKFLRKGTGYILHRSLEDGFKDKLGKVIHKVKASKTLRDGLANVKNSNENDFLKEAIDCFEIGAYRATIIMVWNLVVDHLFEFIIANALHDFNNALSQNTDKRIKISVVSNKDDFSEIPEGKFIELCRSGNIISNDIRKILENKLGVRNSCAHPSGIKIKESKAIEFIEDAVNNIIVKYSLI